jgi:exonuclease VII small subunit
MPQQTSHEDIHVLTLEERQAQLEHRVEQYESAVHASEGCDPSLGRELDASCSLLAQVRAELALLLADEGSDD